VAENASYSVVSVYFFLDYETIGTAATPGLLCQPRVIMKMISHDLRSWRRCQSC
jgi:hypothetical protein